MQICFNKHWWGWSPPSICWSYSFWYSSGCCHLSLLPEHTAGSHSTYSLTRPQGLFHRAVLQHFFIACFFILPNCKIPTCKQKYWEKQCFMIEICCRSIKYNRRIMNFLPSANSLEFYFKLKHEHITIWAPSCRLQTDIYCILVSIVCLILIKLLLYRVSYSLHSTLILCYPAQIVVSYCIEHWESPWLKTAFKSNKTGTICSSFHFFFFFTTVIITEKGDS